MSDSGSGRGHVGRAPIPPTTLVLLAVVSVQLGSAVAKNLFAELGPGGAALVRVGFAALVLLIARRPQVRGRPLRHLAIAVVFGLEVAAMNLCFYSALNRIPLGVAVTLEIVGPLAVAVAGSRRTLDLLWVMLAALGIILLAPWAGVKFDAWGIVFALLAGSFWALYIVLSVRVGRVFPGAQGLAIAMAVGGVALLPVGIGSAGLHLLRPLSLIGGLAVALLSSVVPYSLELEALRTLPTRVFSILMSLEPAVAALVGYVALRQTLELRALAALLLISIASLGASKTGPPVVD